MHRIASAAILLSFLMAGSALASVATIHEYNFAPSPSGNDLTDLNHDSYYKWGINWSLPAGQDLLDATLTFTNIRNWASETNVLYAHLLPSATVGVTAYSDDQSTFVDNFTKNGNLPNTPLHTWWNLGTHGVNLVYAFDSNPNDNGKEMTALATYVADGNFGIGLDPDCHFCDCGVNLQIHTIEFGGPPLAPEPLTVLGMFLGLGGVGGYIRRRLA
jgi:hypothetical protein